jgi:hypothetical protein
MLTTAVVAMLSGSALPAQDRPDFTGTWLMDMSRSESVAQQADASPSMPTTVRIVQTAKQVTVETIRDGEPQTVTYSFEERARPEAGFDRSEEFTVQPAHVEWKGTDLVTTTIYRLNGMPVKQTQHSRLGPSGQEMLVETRLEMQHGYQTNHPEYQSYSVMRDVFTKVSP